LSGDYPQVVKKQKALLGHGIVGLQRPNHEGAEPP
jgi:hypothetical protein